MPEPQDLPFTHLHVISHMGLKWDSATIVLEYLKNHKGLRQYLLKKIAASRDTWIPFLHLTHPTFNHYMKLQDVKDDRTFLNKIEESLEVEKGIVS